MANTILIKRGLKAALPVLTQGEPAYCTDTDEVYIGDGAANHRIGPSEENFTSTLKTKLDGAVIKSDFNATTFLYAVDNDTPLTKTPAEVMGILTANAAADFSMNTHKITAVVNPTAAQDAATKSYVDNLASAGLHWLEMVKDKDTLDPPGAPNEGDRYWIGGVGINAWNGHNYDIAEWDGSAWVYTDTAEGDVAYVDDENLFYFYTGAALAIFATAVGNHHTTHESGGADAIKLDDLSAPDDNTNLDASTTKHGLLKKLDDDATHFLDGQGAWTVALRKSGVFVVGDLIKVNNTNGILEPAGITASAVLINSSTIDGGSW